MKPTLPATMATLAAALALMPAIAASTLAAAAEAQSTRPNILFIMADDHGRQAMSCYDDSLIKTPNLDRLARQGIRFTQAFANNSICSPSRASLITGKYNHRCGVERIGDKFDGSQQTFPKLLQQTGYQTALIGKWHLISQPTGFDHYAVVPLGAHVNPPMTDETMPWKGEGGGPRRQGYSTDLLTDLSMKWMDDQKDKPFCLMLHYTAPHSPHIPAPRHKDLFKNTVFPEPATLLDNYAGRAPEPVAEIAEILCWSRLMQMEGEPYASLKKQFTGDRAHDTRLIYQAYVRNYLRMVASIDENVGRLMDHLEKSGLAANTIVVYTSDNGYFLGEHGFYNKMWMYEEGSLIPLIVRMPGTHAGTTSDRIVSMIDVAPTILDFADVKVPDDIQGCSMKPLILGKPAKWRDSFYYHYYGYSCPPSTNWMASPNGEIFGIRTATAKLIGYPKWKGGPFWEYFDLAADPKEMKNLIADPARQTEIAAAKKRLAELAAQYQDTEVVQALESPAKNRNTMHVTPPCGSPSGYPLAEIPRDARRVHRQGRLPRSRRTVLWPRKPPRQRLLLEARRLGDRLHPQCSEKPAVQAGRRFRRAGQATPRQVQADARKSLLAGGAGGTG